MVAWMKCHRSNRRSGINATHQAFQIFAFGKIQRQRMIGRCVMPRFNARTDTRIERGTRDDFLK